MATLRLDPSSAFGRIARCVGGPARIRTWNPRIWSPMLCQLELLTLFSMCCRASRLSRPRTHKLHLSNFAGPTFQHASWLGRNSAQEILPSLCTVCARHFGQNFLIENLSVCVFLFLVVV